MIYFLITVISFLIRREILTEKQKFVGILELNKNSRK